MIEVGEGTGLVYCWGCRSMPTARSSTVHQDGAFEGTGADILLQVNYTGNASVPLYRRRCLDQVGAYDVTLRERDGEGCEDLDVALKVAEQSGVAVVPSWLVGYRRRRDNMSTRTDRMWRSYALVMQGVRRRRPGLSPALIRKSQHQFALYLAGVSFRSGAYRKAIGFGMACVGDRPGASSSAVRHLVVLEDVPMASSSKPEESSALECGSPTGRCLPPLIPYDRIYERRFKQLRTE